MWPQQRKHMQQQKNCWKCHFLCSPCWGYIMETKPNNLNLRKLQQGIDTTETKCQHWNIKINEDKTQDIYFSHRLMPPWGSAYIQQREHPLRQLCKICGWRLSMEIIEAKAVGTFITVYCLLKSECLSTYIKLTHHKALIRSVITYAYIIWEFAADIHLLKWQHPQNKILCTIGNFRRSTPVHNLCLAFYFPL
jgi:hypothetical protein